MATYYVNTAVGSSGNGLSEANAFKTIQEGINAAFEGDTVWVKTGDYGYVVNTTQRDGTSGNPIRIVGYLNTIGDINATSGSTYTVAQWEANGRDLPTNVMPIMRNYPTNQEPAETDKGFQVNHSYIEIENFMVRGYQYGVDSTSGEVGVKVKNLFAYKLGDWDPNDPNYGGSSVPNPTNQTGVGVRLTGCTNSEVTHTTIIDSGFVGMWIIGGGSNTWNYNKIYVKDSGNATDYLSEINNSSNNTVSNHYAERDVPDFSVGHQGRGLAIKGGGNNTVTNLECLNVRVQLNVRTIGNYFENVTLTGSGGINQNEFQVYGESDNNIIKNIRLTNGGGIQFLGWTGGELGIPSGDYPSGDNNYFINVIIDNLNAFSGNGAVSFQRLTPSPADAGENYIINMTVDDAPWVINANRTGIIHIYNSTFSNIYSGWDTFYAGFPDERENYTAHFYNCNFDNSTNVFGSITDDLNAQSTQSNTINVPPLFTNAGADDFTLQQGSGLINAGIDGSTINTNADTDFDGGNRGVGGLDDIGAFEFGSVVVPPVLNIRKRISEILFMNN